MGHSSGPCHRCGRIGHLARECNLQICFRCNGKGHLAWECLDGITCSRCGDKGHLQRNCKNVSCHRCGRKGHISKFCSDPFIKAREAERHEHQQALLKRKSNDEFENFTSLTRPAVSATQRLAPGPWDGLGNRGRDKAMPAAHCSVDLVRIGKFQMSRVQPTVGNLKILAVRRKIHVEGNEERSKRLQSSRDEDAISLAVDSSGPATCTDNAKFENASWGNVLVDCGSDSTEMRNIHWVASREMSERHRICRDQGTDSDDNCIEPPTCADNIKDKEPSQWNGLLDYGSGDSRDESYPSDVDDEKNSSFEEPVQMKLKTSHNVDGPEISLHSVQFGMWKEITSDV